MGLLPRLGTRGDRVIVMTYAQLSAEELEGFQPTVVLVDHDNRVIDGPLPVDDATQALCLT